MAKLMTLSAVWLHWKGRGGSRMVVKFEKQDKARLSLGTSVMKEVMKDSLNFI